MATLGIKDTKQIVYRTVSGAARLASPRLYSRCAACGTNSDSRQTFSPLAQALPERTHPLCWGFARQPPNWPVAEAGRKPQPNLATCILVPTHFLSRTVRRSGHSPLSASITSIYALIRFYLESKWVI